MEIKSSTTEGLRRFYEKDAYRILKNDYILAIFGMIYNQNKERFSDRILNKLFVLNLTPNAMWVYFLSVYLWQIKMKMVI